MTTNHIRNIIAILLVMTLANLAASFAALRAVRSVRDDNKARIQRIDSAVQRLSEVTTRLCAEQRDNCSTQTVSEASGSSAASQ